MKDQRWPPAGPGCGFELAATQPQGTGAPGEADPVQKLAPQAVGQLILKVLIDLHLLAKGAREMAPCARFRHKLASAQNPGAASRQTLVEIGNDPARPSHHKADQRARRVTFARDDAAPQGGLARIPSAVEQILERVVRR